MTQSVRVIRQSALNPWVIAIILAIPVFLNSLDLTVVSAFLPELIIELKIPLQTGLDDASWIVSGYLLASIVSLAIMGRVSDLAGRRVVYIVSMIIYIAGSYLVAVAHTYPTDILYSFYRRSGQMIDPAYVNLQVIIIARVIQAFGAGAITPASMALVSDLFASNKRAIVLGFIGAMDTLGWVLGHLYGGLFLQIDGVKWQTIFWINIPITVFALIITLWALRGIKMKRSKGYFDLFGAVFIVSALICMSVGLGGVDLNTAGTNIRALASQTVLPFNWGLIGISAILLLIFILIESRVKSPLINLHLFRRRNVNMGLIANLLIGYCLFIGLVSVPILINIRQESIATMQDAALLVGIILGTLTIPMAVATLPGGWLTERFGYRRTIVGGLAISTIGFLWMWRTWTLEVNNWIIVAQMVLIGTGIGLTFSPISAGVVNSADDDEHGVASSLVLIMRLIGMTISTTSLTSFALNRVNYLASEQLAGVAVNSEVYLRTYATIAAGVLAEIGLIGAVIAVLAMLPALLMKDEHLAKESA